VGGRSPKAAKLVGEILSIPAHEKLSEDEQGLVIVAINKFFEAGS
jgi:dTDP-4-amino-4,6-dideoxygalactose transaminase